ncbi:MAG: hypothetical protein AAFO17_17075 [Pseudomonadota bacterium]
MAASTEELDGRLEALDERLAHIQARVATTWDIWVAMFASNLGLAALVTLGVWLSP